MLTPKLSLSEHPKHLCLFLYQDYLYLNILNNSVLYLLQDYLYINILNNSVLCLLQDYLYLKV